MQGVTFNTLNRRLPFAHNQSTNEHKNNQTNITVFEADDRGRDEVLLGVLIAGPIYLTAVIFTLILAIHQKLDMRRICRSEEALAVRLRALEDGM